MGEFDAWLNVTIELRSPGSIGGEVRIRKEVRASPN